MKITLVAPQSYRQNVAVGVTGHYRLNPPVGLLYLAATVADAHEVRIVDAQVLGLSTAALAREILSTDPDLVGVSVNSTTLIPNAVAVARALKLARPDMLLVAGGNCPTFLDRWFCEAGRYDAVFRHEADKTFPAFVAAIQHNTHWNVDGITWCRDGTVHTNPSAGYVHDLNLLARPRYELLPQRERYLPTVVLSRGCSFQCIGCSTKNMWGPSRFRSPDSVVQEIDDLWNLGYRTSIAFCDDESLSRRTRALRVAELLEERAYRYAWGIAGRLELVDDELLDRFSRAGCQQIFFEIESGSDPVRRRLRRALSMKEVGRVIDRCRAFGILPIASFTVGLPHETRQDALRTLEAMRMIGTCHVQLSIFTPLPGTPAFKTPERYGIRLNAQSEDFGRANIDVGTVMHATEYLSEAEIRALWYEGQAIITRRYQEERERYNREARETRARRRRRDRCVVREEGTLAAI